MPMHWTPDNDQLLLKLLIEKQAIKVDGTLIANSWPIVPGEERPTARAIKERVFKIRSSGSKTIEGNGSSADSNVNPTVATPKTKNKSKAPASSSKKTAKQDASPAKPSRKRKAVDVLPTTEANDNNDDNDDDDDDDNKDALATPVKKEIKLEHGGSAHGLYDHASFPISPAATTPGNDLGSNYYDPGNDDIKYSLEEDVGIEGY